MTGRPDDKISQRLSAWRARVDEAKTADLYFFNQPIDELCGGSRAMVRGREMLMFASYSYLGLIGHPKINAAAKAAVDQHGTGTHGVRLLAGSLRLHTELEETIAQFKKTEAAITYSSGFVTNVAAITALVGRHDYVFSDKINHASIVEGCILSGANFIRFKHNDMSDLERCLQKAESDAAKLVVVDAVFSMDGDIINLPEVSALCRNYGAWLMVDEAHSVGVLGATGRGLEEHFGLDGVIDVKMGTLSKTIPSVGGYIAGSHDLINLLRHASRPYIFSAALPPAQAAAAKAAFEVILEEPWRIVKLRENTDHFLGHLKEMGFNTLYSETAIVPILCGPDERAFAMAALCQREDVFALPVVSPAVPEGLARLRATVTAAHSPDEINRALEVMERAGRAVGVI
jgi:glycine C-acetyltransferase